jgi:hypothetical protein
MTLKLEGMNPENVRGGHDPASWPFDPDHLNLP